MQLIETETLPLAANGAAGKMYHLGLGSRSFSRM